MKKYIVVKNTKIFDTLDEIAEEISNLISSGINPEDLLVAQVVGKPTLSMSIGVINDKNKTKKIKANVTSKGFLKETSKHEQFPVPNNENTLGLTEEDLCINCESQAAALVTIEGQKVPLCADHYLTYNEMLSHKGAR